MRTPIIAITLVALLGAGTWLIFLRTGGQSDSITNNIMFIASKNFENHSRIPRKYTCDGEDALPQLHWGDIPEGTKSLVLLVVDPDAPGGDFVHWIVKDIPPSITEIPEGGLPPGTEVENSFGKTSWGGPCPPSGEHRYFFKVYALDTESIEGLTKDTYAEALGPHVLAEAQMVGLYRRGE